ncbi:MAG TPA: hypothetical protein VN856_09030 [Mycobacterium sp.]|uniref:hypothetical protein n=1 Tax=Mycobacterium sp. TaxID=1785 RepID=UPI002C9D3068|nr:hypothetical protein [Mycobacterium sp.]HXO80014.1 hypothetical protein [Mycobacterium sp.]
MASTARCNQIEDLALILVVLLELDDGPRRPMYEQNALPPITDGVVDFGELEQRSPPSGTLFGVTD